MQAFLLYGVDSIEDDHSFEVFLMKIRLQEIIHEWERHRVRLMHGWEHDIDPYAEALTNGDVPDRDKLRALYEKEMKQ
jgi:hypothetical protein